MKIRTALCRRNFLWIKMQKEGLQVPCTKLNGLSSENQKVKRMEGFPPNDTAYDKVEQFEPTVIYLPIFPCLPCVIQMPRIPVCWDWDRCLQITPGLHFSTISCCIFTTSLWLMASCSLTFPHCLNHVDLDVRISHIFFSQTKSTDLWKSNHVLSLNSGWRRVLSPERQLKGEEHPILHVTVGVIEHC